LDKKKKIEYVEFVDGIYYSEQSMRNLKLFDGINGCKKEEDKEE